MKKLEQKVKGFLCLPITESAERKIGDVGMLEATVIKSGVVLTKSEMTAMDVLETIEGLEEIIKELYNSLVDATGICSEDCDQAETEDAVTIKLPEFILEDAGIPKDAKLCAFTTEASGEVTVMEAEYKHDLTDVSVDMLRLLKDIGVCLSCLNECLMTERIIYGKQQ
jgi:hypothetical protein